MDGSAPSPSQGEGSQASAPGASGGLTFGARPKPRNWVSIGGIAVTGLGTMGLLPLPFRVQSMLGNLLLLGVVIGMLGIVLSLVGVFRRKDWWLGLVPLGVLLVFGILFSIAFSGGTSVYPVG